MAFIQIVEFTSSRFEEMAKVADQYQDDSEGKRTVRRSNVCVDRDDPSRYFVIAEFDSYESAMENSSLPETQALAEKMQAVADGPPTFHNLEVVRSYP